MLDKAGVKTEFVDGLRVTDKSTMEVAEMVLSGAVNKELAHLITDAGREADVRGVGLSGKDARLMIVEKAKRTRKDPDSLIEQVVDLGFVGEPAEVDPTLIQTLITANEDYIPVIAPIGVAADGATYNINADTAAGALAGALSAKRFLLLSDVMGVQDAKGGLVRELSVADAQRLIDSGVATGGMIPKLETTWKRPAAPPPNSGSRRHMAPTKRRWPIPKLTPSIIRCRITCTCPGQRVRPRPASMSSAKNPSP
jgi:acetylglutamate kinase